jgi:uncharacterized protein (DUF1810 family)
MQRRGQHVQDISERTRDTVFGVNQDLERFVDAQNYQETYERALAELRAGRKTSHWMWFIFPQVAGLGSSPMARAYALPDLAEAQEYLRHPVLGPRLLTVVECLLMHTDRSAVDILGQIDAVKLRSSMTLFARADPNETLFRRILDEFFDGQEDSATLDRLRSD